METKSIAPVSYATTWTSGNRSLRVHQTEVIGRVSANSTWFPGWNDKYSVATFPINPANPKTFPWLSYIARLYDKYRFYGLRFIYVNSVSTQTEGNLMMSLDYDTLDAAPANLIEASQLAKYKVSPLYCPCDFSIPVNHPGNSNWLYTFDLSATTNTVDLKTYNLGNVFLSLDGVPQDGKDYGYLAVEYDVELLDKNPVINVFASLTYDSGAPAAKRERSNVDPADTMELTATWAPPSDDSTTNTCTLTFSDNVSVGTKCRVLLSVTAAVENTTSTSKNIGISSAAVSEAASILGSQKTQGSGTSTSSTSKAGMVLNLDVIVPEAKTITATYTTITSSVFKKLGVHDDYYTVQAMAYSYA